MNNLPNVGQECYIHGFFFLLLLFFVGKLMWPFGTVSFSLIHIDGLVPINFKKASGLKIFFLTILAGRLLVGS